jgi:hypothetical protein
MTSIPSEEDIQVADRMKRYAETGYPGLANLNKYVETLGLSAKKEGLFKSMVELSDAYNKDVAEHLAQYEVLKSLYSAERLKNETLEGARKGEIILPVISTMLEHLKKATVLKIGFQKDVQGILSLAGFKQAGGGDIIEEVPSDVEMTRRIFESMGIRQATAKKPAKKPARKPKRKKRATTAKVPRAPKRKKQAKTPKVKRKRAKKQKGKGTPNAEHKTEKYSSYAKKLLSGGDRDIQTQLVI